MAKLIDITGKVLSGEWGSDDEVGNGIPVLRTTNFTNDGVVDYSNVVTRSITKKNLEEKYLRNGDIIIEKSGGSDKQPVGRVIYYDGPENTYLFNNFTGLLRVKDTSRWFPRYVFYALFANYRAGGTRQYENKTTGLHNLKTDDYVSRFEISEIRLSQQEEICAILDSIQSVINARKQQLSELANLIKAQFVEMFGNFVFEKNRWETCTVGDVAGTVDPQPSHRTPPAVADGIPYIGIAECNYTTLQVDFEKARKVSQDVLDEHLNRYTLADGDFIIGKIGTIGKPFFIPCKQNYTLSANTVLIQPDSSKVYPNFLFSLFQSEYMDRIIDSEKKSTSQPAFGIQKVRAIEIPLPPMRLQKQYADFCKQVDKSKVVVQKALNETQMLFDSLMQEYFG